MNLLSIDDPKNNNPFQSTINLTPIICTIGPACNNEETLMKMVKNGMRIARLNFSHGDHKYHEDTIRLLERVRSQTGRQFAIALDTKGPEIRTGNVKSDLKFVNLKNDSLITFTNDPTKYDNCTSDLIYIDYKSLSSLHIGSSIYIEDGLMQFKVIKIIDNKSLLCQTLSGGQLGSKKGVNLPGIKVDLPAMTQKDKEDLEFGIRHKVDIIFASFVRSKDHVIEMKNFLKDKGDKDENIFIISKIENAEGLENFDEILGVSDGIMAARGDMGIETTLESIPLKQRIMSQKCLNAGKPFIVATQMLESMITNPRGTRAEVNDIASAVLNGASCVMLSGETAKGKYPVEAVQTQSNVVRFVESHLDELRATGLLSFSVKKAHRSFTHPASFIAKVSGAKFILAFEKERPNIQKISSIINTLPEVPVIYMGTNEQEIRRYNLNRSILPTLINLKSIDLKDTEKTKSFLLEQGIKSFNNYVDENEKHAIKKGDNVIILMTDAHNFNLMLTTV